ncbi:MAG: sigma-70 family RNA polymerase sigma factor [Phycisphaerae bacterium]|jgi:RNA polymerase sigma factor (sigma-70 family)|nr:sigma-70 family RNA polymerase sigma factor [Phycisphaerae bacterium]
MSQPDAASKAVPPNSPSKGRELSTGAATGEPTDGELIRLCRQGDQAAWSRLIQRYERLVYSVPRRLGVSPELVEETFQEVWVVLVRRLSSLQHEQALPQWLITTARRIALRAAARARSRAGSTEGLLDAPQRALVDLPETDFVERAERGRQVADALDRLDPACRDLLMAIAREGQSSYAELSKSLGMPIGSIGPKRARCLERLSQLLPPSLRADLGSNCGGTGSATESGGPCTSNV